MTLSDRIAQHVRQKRSLALKGGAVEVNHFESPTGTWDANAENAGDTTNLSVNASPARHSKHGKIVTSWKSHSSMLSDNNNDCALSPAKPSAVSRHALVSSPQTYQTSGVLEEVGGASPTRKVRSLERNKPSRSKKQAPRQTSMSFESNPKVTLSAQEILLQLSSMSSDSASIGKELSTATEKKLRATEEPSTGRSVMEEPSAVKSLEGSASSELKTTELEATGTTTNSARQRAMRHLSNRKYNRYAKQRAAANGHEVTRNVEENLKELSATTSFVTLATSTVPFDESHGSELGCESANNETSLECKASDESVAKESNQEDVTIQEFTVPNNQEQPRETATDDASPGNKLDISLAEAHEMSRTQETPSSTRNRMWSALAKKMEMSSAERAVDSSPCFSSALSVSSARSDKDTTPLSNRKIRRYNSHPLSGERDAHRNPEDPSKRRQSLNNTPDTADGGMDTRKNLDKRTARLRFSKAFAENLYEHLSREGAKRSEEPQDNSVEVDDEDIYRSEQVVKNGGVAIFVRKRPIFPYEIARKDFDVVSMSSSPPNGEKVTIHNCFMHPDMMQLKIKSTVYPCTMAFDETSSDDRIYQVLADPLVKAVAVDRTVSTILLYGQTGSGKSYTMNGIETRMCEQLFRYVSEGGRSSVVTIRFVELAGKSCRDLLAPMRIGGEATSDSVKIVDRDDGTVQILNAMQKVVKTPDELASFIARGKSRRATEATNVNAVSSRSHAICQIEVFSPNDWKNKSFSNRGILSLIDCAGSERRNDSLYHDSSRQKETSEINASLYALKECVRARAKLSSKNPYVPYRASNLTRLLRESFEKEDAKLCVIATVAPNATDTEHTMETLKMVSSIVGNENLISSEEPKVFYPEQNKIRAIMSPKEMNHAQLVKWLKSQKISTDFIPEKVDGKSIMRLTAKQLGAQLLNGDEAVAIDLFKKLRNENDRISKIQLEQRKHLKDSNKPNRESS